MTKQTQPVSDPVPDAQPAAEKRPSRRQRAKARALEVAAGPSTGRLRLWLLARRWRADIEVGRAIVRNPKAGNAAIRVAVNSALRQCRWQVAVAAAETRRCSPSLNHRLATCEFPAVHTALAASPHTPPATLKVLSHYGPSVRLHLATNPALTADDVEPMLRDANPFVRCVAAAHPNASPSGLVALCDGLRAPAWMLRAAAANPACPGELSEQILTWLALGGAGDADPRFDPVTCKGHPGPTTTNVNTWYFQTARDESAWTHPLWRVRATYALSRQRSSIRTLTWLAADPRPEVRRTVTRFNGIPWRVLRALAVDDDIAMQRLAAAAIQTKRVTWRKQRPQRWGRNGLRFLPFAAVVTILSLTNLGRTSSPSLDTLTNPADNAAVAGGLALPEGNVVTTAAMPGGGEIQSGDLQFAAVPFINVDAGSVALTVDIPGSFLEVGSVLQTTSGSLTVQAGQEDKLILPTTTPGPMSVTVTGSDGSTTTVTLNFGSS